MIDNDNRLDSNRIGVYGGSYGGYMVLASMTHYNDRLRAAVDVVGISNFVTFLQNTKSYRRDLRRAEYGDERNEDMYNFLQEISPNNNVKKLQNLFLLSRVTTTLASPLPNLSKCVTKLKKWRICMVHGCNG